MFCDIYQKLEKADKTDFLSKIKDELVHFPIEEDKASVIRCPLDFYPSHTLYEIIDNNVMPPQKRFLIVNDDTNEVRPLEFSSDKIYLLNKTIGIDLREYNILDYIKFFFHFSRGRHGRFLIVSSVDDVHWQEEPPLAARRAIATMIAPLEIISNDSNNHFYAQATMIFKDSLIRADIKISHDGMVTLSNEEILVEDMPITDDAIG